MLESENLHNFEGLSYFHERTSVAAAIYSWNILLKIRQGTLYFNIFFPLSVIDFSNEHIYITNMMKFLWKHLAIVVEISNSLHP